MKQTEKYLALAMPENRKRYEGWKQGLPEDWAGGQAAFLRMTGEYLRKEAENPSRLTLGLTKQAVNFGSRFPI